MSRMQTLAFVSAIAVLGATAPVFAQSFNPEYGTANARSYYDQNGVLRIGTPGAGLPQLAIRQRGTSAFAKVPEAASGSYSPALSGGGSIGYNQDLLRD